ncbi:hypothetical protein PIB30_059064 [Stylosanthes scabra]|uniref:Late embryogenesis abundant protein LEA-2 subgroup domain-containing protein n=1 Tax=Stylosanthes scabra TaxID=79078 RepID=A0ABU6RKH5_9FABA|nr:hypothetical protein [Stylosanthes scabra]
MDDPSSSSQNNGKGSTKDKSKGKEHSPSTSSSSNNAWGPPPPNMPYHNYPPQPYPPPGPPGYPPPPPYQPYPPPPYDHDHHHQHHNNYYAHQPYDYPPNRDAGRGFIRGFILCSCIMFTAFFIVTIVVALAMHPSLPKYQITSMSVDNFAAANTLTGNWYTTILVENPNDKLTGYFGDFKVFVEHKGRELTGGYAPGFVLPRNEKKQFSVNTPASNFGNFPDLDAMAKERASGSVTFDVTITSVTELKSSSVSTNPESLTAVCEGLKLVFQNNSTAGTLENRPVDCEIRL